MLFRSILQRSHWIRLSRAILRGASMPELEYLLTVRGLKKYFPIRKGVFSRVAGYVQAVDDVSFQIRRGETFGLVGESGCGKTTTGRSILRLIEPDAGEVIFEGLDLLKMKPEVLRRKRQDLQIIFQDPFSSLNPRMTVRRIIGEPFAIQGQASGSEREDRVAELLKAVGLDPDVMSRFPHEFSGGQRQRIGIARALALKPKFLVADEPVSALDVSIQAQIIVLLKNLTKEHGTAVMLITHDMGVIAETADRVAVMYAGRIAEIGPVRSVIRDAHHPYTVGLMGAIPKLGAGAGKHSERLAQIEDRKSTRLNSSHVALSRMPSSA